MPDTITQWTTLADLFEEDDLAGYRLVKLYYLTWFDGLKTTRAYVIETGAIVLCEKPELLNEFVEWNSCPPMVWTEVHHMLALMHEKKAFSIEGINDLIPIKDRLALQVFDREDLAEIVANKRKDEHPFYF